MPAIASRGKGRRAMTEINMVPFIDVMLVLLIIFMVTAPLITPSQIELPTVGQGKAPPKTYVQVIVNKDGQLEVKDGTSNQRAEPVGKADLAARVKALQAAAGPSEGGIPVVISADKNVKYEAVIEAMDTLQRAGVQRLGLSVQPVR